MACPHRFYKHAALANIGLKNINIKRKETMTCPVMVLNPLNAELNPICHLLALLGAHHILHVSRIMIKE
jgi:hypothetical protein